MESSDGVYFSDLKTSLRNSVKYDVFAGSEQIATLVTNNRKTFALTTEGQKLSLQAKWKWFDRFFYYLSDGAGNRVATILARRPPFRNTVYQITFENSNEVCLLTRKTRRDSREANADFIYEISQGLQTVCTITNYRKPPVISIGRSPLKGTIQFAGNPGILEILCFLQFVNVHMDIQYD
jgi:hypothetical protein